MRPCQTRTRLTVRPLRAVKDLGWRDRFEVARIVCLAAAVEAGLRVLPLPRLARLLRVELDLQSTELGVPMTVRPPGWAVQRIMLTRAVLKYSGQTCLRNSLVVACRLRPLSPRVRIGVSKTGDRLAAHAWLEVNGEYFDPGAGNYRPVHFVGP